MRFWARFAFAAAAPLLLASCLWGPGKFSSTLALNKAGTFVLDYKGEILLQLPEDKVAAAEPWDENLVTCADEPDKPRPCTRDEIEKAKAAHAQEVASAAAKRQENEQMAKIFGLPGSDDESNRAFAAKLMKFKGWRSVAYKGKGLFDVDYHLEGRLDQDFAFPLMPDSDLMIPFVAIRRRTDGTVLVTAPAFTGGSGPFGARAKAMGLPDKGSEGPVSRADGRFTIITDGEILTNNSEDGPVAAPGGRRVQWDVDAGSTKIPELMVRL